MNPFSRPNKGDAGVSRSKGDQAARGLLGNRTLLKEDVREV